MVRRQDGSDTPTRARHTPGTPNEAGQGVRPAFTAENAGDNRLVRNAATLKSRTRALARRLRKGSRMASLTAEISSGIEKAAGCSDRIIESFGEAEHGLSNVTVQVREGIELLQSLSGITGELRRAGAEHTAAVEDASGAFRGISGAVRSILASVQNDARTHSEVLKAVQELVKWNETVELAMGNLARLMEHSEIASVNAALAAVKTGDSGAEFGVLAAAAQKYVASFERNSGEYIALIGAQAPQRAPRAHLESPVAAVHRALLDKTVDASERICAVEVMTKGVRNAFDEAAESVDALMGVSAGIAGGIERIGSDIDRIAAGNDLGAVSVERATESIRHAVSLMEEQETMFAGAADHAEALLAATGRLAAAGDIPAVLEDIFSGTETFIRSVEATLERLDLSLSAIHDAAHEMDGLRRGSCIGGETLDRLVKAAGEAVGEAERFDGILSRIRTGRTETLDVLGNVVRELDLLAGEGDVIGEELVKLKQPYHAFSHLAGHLTAFAVRMECLATGMGVAAARSASFSGHPGEFEAIAAESEELERTIADLADRLSEQYTTIAARHDARNWRETVTVFSGVVADMRDLIDTRFNALAVRNTLLLEHLAARSKKVEKTRTKSEAACGSAEEAHHAVNRAAETGENQRMAFLEIIAAAEKVCSLADELSPEEE